jgi:hypothetical protein
MTSKYTTELLDVRQAALDAGQFKFNPRSYKGKIYCVQCFSDGYPGGSWMDKHIAGHASCSVCGRVYPISTLNLHRTKQHADV